ncbi:MAG: DegT/DnrJ/EryC1/StrS family aminotransferase, partial [Candidatus Marisimplicoccus sp.]
DEIGVNSRLDSIQAAILNVKLKYLNIYNKRRIAAASEYSSRLESINEIETPYVEFDSDSHVFHQYTIKVKNGNRDKLAEFLSSKEIPFGIYYPLGFHEQKAYKNNFNQSENFENTNIVKDQVISLPMHTELSKSQIDFICNSIKEFFNNK